MYVMWTYFSLGMLGSQIAILSLVAFMMLIKCYHSTSDAEHVCGLIASVKLLDTEAKFVYDTLFERIKTNFGLFYQTEDT